jgi:type II secretion system protein J
MTIKHEKTSLRRYRSGFTLIELLVALAIAVVILVPLYTSLRVAFKAKDSSEAALTPSRTAEMAMDYLRNDLQNALPATGTLNGAFEGTKGTDDRGYPGDDVNFFSTADSPEHPDGNGEIKNIELCVKVPPGSSDHVLLRRVTRNLLSQVTIPPDDEVICRRVMGFSVQYFTGSNWLANWDSTQEDNTIPVAVEITLDLQRPDGNGTFRTVRVFPMPCSTAASDSTVNTGSGLQ